PARYRHYLWVLALVLSVVLPLGSVLDIASVYPPAAAGPSVEVNPAAVDTATRPAIAQEGTLNGWAAALRNAAKSITLSPVMTWAWVGGYGLFLLSRLIRLGRAWQRTNTVGRSAYHRRLTAELEPIWARCQAALGLENISIFCSPDVAGPSTIGARHPRII